MIDVPPPAVNTGEPAAVGEAEWLPPAEWSALLSAAEPSMPFAAPQWINLGLTAASALRFTPLMVRWGTAGRVLLPLCATGTTGQIGCFGYGTPCAVGVPEDLPLPGFASLARSVAARTGVTGLNTLLPPVGAVPALDRATGHWADSPGPTTFLLDLGNGAAGVWAAAKGSVRTAVRRARAAGLRTLPASADLAPALAHLHQATMVRNGEKSPYRAEDFTSLLPVRTGVDAAAPGAVTVVVTDRDGPQAASVFAAWRTSAFHIMQLTSEQGRRTNAGHLAFWTAVEALTDRGVAIADLGAATGHGHERFKTNWGATPAPTRIVRWPHHPDEQE